MRILVLAICVLFAGCMANTSESQEEQDIKCGAFDRCNPWFVNSNGVVVHNVSANSACDLACTADGWAGGFCPLTNLGALEEACTNQCNGQVDKETNPALWRACWANCVNSQSIACQAGDEPVSPETSTEDVLDASKFKLDDRKLVEREQEPSLQCDPLARCAPWVCVAYTSGVVCGKNTWANLTCEGLCGPGARCPTEFPSMQAVDEAEFCNTLCAGKDMSCLSQCAAAGNATRWNCTKTEIF